MTRAVVPVTCALALFAAGCDDLFHLAHVDPTSPLPDAATDAPTSAAHLVQQQGMAVLNTIKLEVTLQDAPLDGDVLVLIGATDRFNLRTPVGGGVATWLRADAAEMDANVEIWYGVTDGSSSVVGIECSCSNAGDMRLLVTEWAGLLTTRLLDNNVHKSDVTTTASPGPITTADGPDLLIFAVSSYYGIDSTVTGTGTWSQLTPLSVGGASQLAWYQLDMVPGTYSPSVMVTGSWDGVIAAFREQPAP